MSHYVDLSPYVTLKTANPRAVAVGWLAKDHSFTSGPAAPELVARLEALVRSRPWEPYYTVGPHFCEFCPPQTAGGTQTLWIPGEAHVYVSPSLIAHYVGAHGYQPPDCYVSAVLACPSMHSEDYFRELARHGIVGKRPPWAEPID
jgi:hypothetical protein